MKILLIQETDWIKRGPHQQHHLMDRMSLRGHQIHVIDYDFLWKDEGERKIFNKERIFQNEPKIFPNAKIQVRRPGIIKLPLIDYISVPYFHTKAIKKEIQTFKPDVIISFGLLNAYIGLKIAKKHNIPYVYYLIDHVHTLLPLRPAQPIGKWLESKTIKGANRIFVINEGLLDYAIDLGGERKKGRYIPAGVDLEKYREITYRDKIRKKYGIAEDETLLFFMGWLYDFSGIKEVCEALIENCMIYPKIKIMVVGEGDLLPYLKSISEKSKEAKSRIILTGKVPFDDIPKYLSAADICLLPAYKNKIMENIVPIKLYEYLAAGKPVIATNLNGLKKEFGNILFYVDDHNQVLNESSRISTLAKQKIDNFIEKYNWDEITLKFETEIKSIL
jgi:glycosyltransferase involved in cell wall biosynthesis